LLEGIISGIRSTYGTQIFVDCDLLPGCPRFRPANTVVYRVTDYRGRPPRPAISRAGAQPLFDRRRHLQRRAYHDEWKWRSRRGCLQSFISMKMAINFWSTTPLA